MLKKCKVRIFKIMKTLHDANRLKLLKMPEEDDDAARSVRAFSGDGR